MKKKLLALLMTSALAVAALTGCTVGGSGSASAPAAGSDTAKAADTTAQTTASTQTAASAEDSYVSGESSLKGQNVRIVIGSTSTSGDSYMVADTVNRYLSKEMGFNGKVDAIGNAAALDEIANAKGDGKTVMMFHDMTFMSVLFGAVDEKYSLENMTVGPRIGQNPGACFGAPAEKEYASLKEITEYLKTNPSETVSFNIEAGGTSHIAFSAYYLDVLDKEGQSVADRIRVIVGGTTAEKLQRMWDRNTDVIYGDTSSFEQYTQDGVDDQLKMTMFGSASTVNGVDITSMADEGVEFNGKPFDFAKDFAMYFPKDMDENVLNEYAAAMKRVTENPDFRKDMAALYYTALSADDVDLAASQAYIYDKREMCKQIIDQAPDLDSLTQ